jgi:hypothetical protein
MATSEIERSDILEDHAIVGGVADDDRAVMDRLAALEAEVSADADAQAARKAAALKKLRDQRVTQTAASRARDQLRTQRAEQAANQRPQLRAMPADTGDTADTDDADDADDLEDLTATVRRGGHRAARDRDEVGSLEGLGGALELATKANRVKQELARAPGKGEKSWIKSGLASLALGPVGWLYAGSWREAVPASVAWVALGALALKILPMFLMMPVLMVIWPLSAIAGVVYALQYNRHGSRQRLFNRDSDRDKDKPQKQLRGNSDRAVKSRGKRER